MKDSPTQHRDCFQFLLKSWKPFGITAIYVKQSLLCTERDHYCSTAHSHQAEEQQVMLECHASLQVALIAAAKLSLPGVTNSLAHGAEKPSEDARHRHTCCLTEPALQELLPCADEFAPAVCPRATTT
jgi:hypothetical protein